MMCNCNCRWSCTLFAVVSAAVLGVVAAFLFIAGTIAVTTTFLWVALGIAVVYLAGLVSTHRCAEPTGCLCRALNGLVAGILGTILLSLVLLAVGITATSTLSAVLVGGLTFFLWLTVASAACYVRCAADCD